MKTVRGLEKAIETLCGERKLNLSTVPPHVQERTNEVFGEELPPAAFVERVLSEVRERGDEAVRDISRRLDGGDAPEAPETLEVSASAVGDAYGEVPDELVQALELAARRIRTFHDASMSQGWVDFDEGYGELVIPVDRAGVYAPTGLASSVLMSAIPARAAGVDEVILSTPGQGGGPPNPVMLVAADIAGVNRVFQIGGAQAIAAMAYGTETVPAVDVVCGGGNIFVTLAKKLLYGEVGIDGLNGPTETALIADDSANPTLCAADLLAQAEHDVMAAPVLITTSDSVAKEVEKEISVRSKRLERSAIIEESLKLQGCIAIVDDLDQALELANRYAPEHLSLMVRDPWQYVGRVRSAGAVFVGDFSHEVLGDYVAGPSHVMPTGGTARFGSGLSVRSFLKFSPVVGLDETKSAELGKAASLIARAEGLTGHAEAAEIRDELLNP